MESIDKNQSDLYYSDSAIRERCLKMVCDQRTAAKLDDTLFEPKADATNVAEFYFKYIKTGTIRLEPEE